MLGFFLWALLVGFPAEAQNARLEQQARSLQKKAMEDDYLATEFGKAEEKLARAISLCAADKCATRLRASLRRDLGVIQILGQGDRDKGVQSFAEALKIDPAIALDPDLTTKEVEQAFEEAKRSVGMGLPIAGGSEASTGLDFAHTPAAEQLTGTAVPLYVEYTGPNTLTRVVAHYRSPGMAEWGAVELSPSTSNAWIGYVPCGDIGRGTLQYYLRGYDAQGEETASGGGPTNTYKVPIRTQLEGGPPHLPGEPPPRQCVEDCPPGAPCEKREPLRLEGERCQRGDQCASDECKAGRCTAPTRKYPRFWLGVSGTVDFALIPGASDVCKLATNRAPRNDAGYYCTFNGVDYPSRERGQVENGKLQDGKAGSVTGGIIPGNIRINLTFDYALSKNFLLGVRAGLILRRFAGVEPPNDGRPIVPVHAEIRLTYLLGQDAILKPYAPYFFAATGAAEYSAGVEVPVNETGTPGNKLVDAWSVAGPVFAAAGGGIRATLGDRRNVALLGGLRLNVTLPVVGSPLIPSVGPEIGAQVGF